MAATVPFFAAYSLITARSLAVILMYSPQLLEPSLWLTLYDNSLSTESIVAYEMVHLASHT